MKDLKLDTGLKGAVMERGFKVSVSKEGGRITDMLHKSPLRKSIPTPSMLMDQVLGAPSGYARPR
jgi:hypothetical protein